MFYNAHDYIAVGSLNVQIFDNPTRRRFDLATNQEIPHSQIKDLTGLAEQNTIRIRR